MKRLPKNLARIGQYPTRKDAIKATRHYRISNMASSHDIVKTVTWRNMVPYECFTFELKRGN